MNATIWPKTASPLLSEVLCCAHSIRRIGIVRRVSCNARATFLKRATTSQQRIARTVVCSEARQSETTDGARSAFVLGVVTALERLALIAAVACQALAQHQKSNVSLVGQQTETFHVLQPTVVPHVPKRTFSVPASAAFWLLAACCFFSILSRWKPLSRNPVTLLQTNNRAAAKLLKLEMLSSQQTTKVGELAKQVDRLQTRVRLIGRDLKTPIKQLQQHSAEQAEILSRNTEKAEALDKDIADMQGLLLAMQGVSEKQFRFSADALRKLQRAQADLQQQLADLVRHNITDGSIRTAQAPTPVQPADEATPLPHITHTQHAAQWSQALPEAAIDPRSHPPSHPQSRGMGPRASDCGRAVETTLGPSVGPAGHVPTQQDPEADEDGTVGGQGTVAVEDSYRDGAVAVAGVNGGCSEAGDAEGRSTQAEGVLDAASACGVVGGDVLAGDAQAGREIHPVAIHPVGGSAREPLAGDEQGGPQDGIAERVRQLEVHDQREQSAAVERLISGRAGCTAEEQNCAPDVIDHVETAAEYPRHERMEISSAVDPSPGSGNTNSPDDGAIYGDTNSADDAAIQSSGVHLHGMPENDRAAEQVVEGATDREGSGDDVDTAKGMEEDGGRGQWVEGATEREGSGDDVTTAKGMEEDGSRGQWVEGSTEREGSGDDGTTAEGTEEDGSRGQWTRGEDGMVTYHFE